MIFIVGHHNTGKTTLAKYLKNYHFRHVETGEIIREKHCELAPEVDFSKWAKKHHNEFDRDITTKVNKIRNEIIRSNGVIQDIVITGNRQMSGIDYIIKHVPPINGRKIIIIFLKAAEITLYHRQITRPDKNSEGLTFERFRNEILAYDSAMGVDEIERQATSVFVNEDSPEAIQRKVIAFLNSYDYQFAPHQLIPSAEDKMASAGQTG